MCGARDRQRCWPVSKRDADLLLDARLDGLAAMLQSKRLRFALDADKKRAAAFAASVPGKMRGSTQAVARAIVPVIKQMCSKEVSFGLHDPLLVSYGMPALKVDMPALQVGLVKALT